MSWGRQNRWWLALLPVALVVLVAGSSYRVKTFWWESGYHHVSATAAPGRFVHVVQGFDDELGPTRRTFDVRLDRVGKADTLPSQGISDTPTPIPDGTTAWRLDLSWRAAPDQDLDGCRIALVDASGAVYGGDLDDPLGQVYPCVPENSPGPSSPLGKSSQRGQLPTGTQPRPERWRSSVVVLMPSGVRPKTAHVIFLHPDYVVLPVP